MGGGGERDTKSPHPQHPGPRGRVTAPTPSPALRGSALFIPRLARPGSWRGSSRPHALLPGGGRGGARSTSPGLGGVGCAGGQPWLPRGQSPQRGGPAPAPPPPLLGPPPPSHAPPRPGVRRGGAVPRARRCPRLTHILRPRPRRFPAPPPTARGGWGGRPSLLSAHGRPAHPTSRRPPPHGEGPTGRGGSSPPFPGLAAPRDLAEPTLRPWDAGSLRCRGGRPGPTGPPPPGLPCSPRGLSVPRRGRRGFAARPEKGSLSRAHAHAHPRPG